MEGIGTEHDFSFRLNHWIDEHKGEMFTVLLAGILFFGGLVGFSSWRHHREKMADVALFKTNGDSAGLEKVALDFPATPAGKLAQLELALQSMEKEGETDCESGFEELRSMKGATPFFQVLALHGQARCQAKSKRFTDAAATLEMAALVDSSPVAFWSRFEAAHVLEWEDAALARGAYEKLRAEQNISESVKEEIETRLLWLALQASS